MSVSSHITELRRKHAVLEQRIENELRSPGSDDLRVTELKREKLRLKDQITKLTSTETIH